MASSRIFVKGLPPTFNETDFRKHFSQNGRAITDAKIFPSRRIGYVGYKTPEDAQKAVKYFNKTFIRMSRIGVELARPVDETKPVKGGSKAPTARKEVQDGGLPINENRKRKRESEVKENADPKLKEFLDVMKPKAKKKAWESEDLPTESAPAGSDEETAAAVAMEGESDDEYEQIPKKPKRSTEEPRQDNNSRDVVMDEAPQPPPEQAEEGNDAEPVEDQTNQAPVTDADWARSKTSRLLGLLDDDEEEAVAVPTQRASEEPSDDDGPSTAQQEAVEAPASIPTPPAEAKDATEEPKDADIEGVRSSMRLFVRNLPYDVQREDLEAEFASFGNLEEVSHSLSSSSLNMMILQIGTAYATAFDVNKWERILVDACSCLINLHIATLSAQAI